MLTSIFSTSRLLLPPPPSPPSPPAVRPFHVNAASNISSSSSTHRSDALIEIKDSGVIACLRADSAKLAMDAARAALAGGISVLEIVMSTPGALEVVHDLVLEFPSSIIGVGTVLNSGDATSAVKAGAKFLMSPCTIQEILVDLQGSEILYIPGVMTPTEIIDAYHAGAKIVKIYPVSILGSVHYLSVLQKPFSHIPMVASQGITMDLIGEYIKGGACAVVISDAIFGKEAMQKGKFDEIYQLARRASLQGIQASYRRNKSDVERMKQVV